MTTKIETQGTVKILQHESEILKNNPVEVAEDFDVPQPTAEQLREQQEQQEQQEQMMRQQMPGGPGGMPVPPAGAPKGKVPPAAPKAQAPKPEPKK